MQYIKATYPFVTCPYSFNNHKYLSKLYQQNGTTQPELGEVFLPDMSLHLTEIQTNQKTAFETKLA